MLSVFKNIGDSEVVFIIENNLSRNYDIILEYTIFYYLCSQGFMQLYEGLLLESKYLQVDLWDQVLGEIIWWFRVFLFFVFFFFLARGMNMRKPDDVAHKIYCQYHFCFCDYYLYTILLLHMQLSL